MPGSVDLAIIGAGAAGLTAAIAAAREAGRNNKRLEILLLDSKRKVGAKILMSGGTRCNVTNESVRPSDFEGGATHFVKHVLEAFTPALTVDFFKEIGVELVLEPTGKYFPATHSAQTVLDALLNEANRLGIKLIAGVRIVDIQKTGPGSPRSDGAFCSRSRDGDVFELKSGDPAFCVTAKKVVITTGGLSHPGTGSDGSGYLIAQKFGHSMIQTFPALTPLLTEDSDWKSLSGVSLDAELSFYQKGKKEHSRKGSFLFTHFGFSGPAALDISRYFASAKKEDKPEIKANFLPHEDEVSFQSKFDLIRQKNAGKLIKNFLSQEFLLPGRFSEIFLTKIGIDGSMPIGKCSKEKLRLLVQSLFYYPLEVTGVYGYQKAEVTAGGIDLREIKVQTMESKLVTGLYFAGEILNVDGRIGGFNFQWAWSTGTIAGRSAARSLST